MAAAMVTRRPSTTTSMSSAMTAGSGATSTMARSASYMFTGTGCGEPAAAASPRPRSGSGSSCGGIPDLLVVVVPSCPGPAQVLDPREPARSDSAARATGGVEEVAGLEQVRARAGGVEEGLGRPAVGREGAHGLLRHGVERD